MTQEIEAIAEVVPKLVEMDGMWIFQRFFVFQWVRDYQARHDWSPGIFHQKVAKYRILNISCDAISAIAIVKCSRLLHPNDATAIIVSI